MTKRKSTITPFEEAHFRFGLIAPVIQNVYPDASARAYYRRVTEKPILCPDGIAREYKPATLEKWTTLYRSKGIDGLTPEERSDKGTTRVLNDTAIEEIYRIREKYPRITGVMIHDLLIQDGFINADVSTRAVQRFIKANDLKSARNPNVKDRKAFETPEFGCLWQSDSCYLPAITENGEKRRTYVIMIIDDHSRMIVGGQIFYNDNAYNYQKVLRQAIATYGLPDKLYLDNGSTYSNRQLTHILDSLGIVEIHTPVRDGAAKGKVERNFRTLKMRWLDVLDLSQIHSLEQFNESLRAYIRQHNTTVHSGTGETPLNRYLKTQNHVKEPKSSEWLGECFQNSISRTVHNDSCVSIDGVSYDCPQQFIRTKVEIRYLPDHMEDAYILFDGVHYPIHPTDKAANSKIRRNNPALRIHYPEESAS